MRAAVAVVAAGWITAAAACAFHTPAAASRPEAADVDDYLEGFDRLQKGDTEGALRKLREFLREQPSSPYADDAQYAIGEAYYRSRELRHAIVELEEVVRRWPDGDRVPTAYLREAFALAELGDEAAARRVLRKLVAEHGSSPEAELARRKLAAAAP